MVMMLVDYAYGIDGVVHNTIGSTAGVSVEPKARPSLCGE